LIFFTVWAVVVDFPFLSLLNENNAAIDSIEICKILFISSGILILSIISLGKGCGFESSLAYQREWIFNIPTLIQRM
jgi:hypothetical protein